MEATAISMEATVITKAADQEPQGFNICNNEEEEYHDATLDDYQGQDPCNSGGDEPAKDFSAIFGKTSLTTVNPDSEKSEKWSFIPPPKLVLANRQFSLDDLMTNVKNDLSHISRSHAVKTRKGYGYGIFMGTEAEQCVPSDLNARNGYLISLSKAQSELVKDLSVPKGGNNNLEVNYYHMQLVLKIFQ